jgi:hypothetical protein
MLLRMIVIPWTQGSLKGCRNPTQEVGAHSWEYGQAVPPKGEIERRIVER